MRKTLISMALVTIALAACKKDAGIKPENNAPKPVTTVKKIVQDTIPDGSVIKIQLAMDSVNHDQTMVMFDHTASVNYSALNDALYFPGFGKVSLSSISGDGKNMAIYMLPYTPGLAIGLNINAKNDGDYSLSLNSAKGVPSSLHVWVKDAYAKDSTDVSAGSHNFKVLKADTNSFGSKRFSLVFKQVQPQ